MRFFEKNNQTRTCSAGRVCRDRSRRIDNGDHVTALDLAEAVADSDIRKVDGRAHSRLCVLHLVTMTLDRADARVEILRLNNHALAAMETPASECAGHDGADSAKYESAINKQPRLSEIELWLHGRQLRGDGALQTLDSFASAH